MITVLMVLDAIIGLLLIGSVVMQTPKSAGMGMGGGSDTVFSSSARGLDALLARVTVVLAVLFGVLTLFIAKLTSF
ncbi:MAG: preprotein translocase subunit SecG [Anaerovibrio sp.]|uniref:Protein-export membrane protein SecG n=1 Tax=Anaerovibrio slackiae TaxID=2652309 RepID=A0A6I2UDY5_9FIRM|nr:MULTISPECIES: preprotein translocase subunit SecG [Anaerovibrio]MBQ2009647.1 preprotein translocase subunit SecG [Selenomonadaceae bacterium]MBQ2410336.1 preprotein translocase subunit SecG [Selenomonadaceae bacterium]MBQ5585194.1 preprotein translocase subunit SecG [Selenomonadaceae bacterium]MBQ5650521.1 preprotein translocase subunit SecG [Selenomonadaceae bacterium]MBQ5732580.1 preprotein translocase subunit SecG [Selenomonadaceae bacterium]